MSVGISPSLRPNRMDSARTLAEFSKLLLPSRRRMGDLRRRVKKGTYWVEPGAISRQIAEFYRT
jgi:hypothetical protein